MPATLVLGGARSGKSARALALAGAPCRVFVATAEPLDEEMADRIARHQAERGAEWELIEEPLEIAGLPARFDSNTAMVIDCLTLWLSNLLHRQRDPVAEGGRLVRAVASARCHVVLVSNEIGLGLAPMNGLGRQFRDAQGRLNQQVATVAERVEFVAAGLPLVLKGER